jgi:acetyltransferase-like isoleucine patch superfamily enzyme
VKFKKFSQGYLTLVLDSNIEPNVRVYDRAVILHSSINSFTYIADNTRISQTAIGKFCCIGQNCIFNLGRHPSRDFVSSHPIFFSTYKQVGITFADQNYFEEEKPIKIGNDVWTGANVIILGGLTIGDGAIIAAGAVVTKDVPPYAIYGGVPAKLIRYRFDRKKINFLLDFKWWNKDEEWVKANFKQFHSIDKFVQAYAETENCKDAQ